MRLDRLDLLSIVSVVSRHLHYAAVLRENEMMCGSALTESHSGMRFAPLYHSGVMTGLRFSLPYQSGREKQDNDRSHAFHGADYIVGGSDIRQFVPHHFNYPKYLDNAQARCQWAVQQSCDFVFGVHV
jgi:hypothetical protein